MNYRIDKEAITRIKGKYQEKYGLVMDDWSASMFYENDEKFNTFNGKIEGAIERINDTNAKIKGQIRTYKFDDFKSAFFFAVGKTLFPCITILILALIVAIIYGQSSTYRQYKYAPYFKQFIANSVIVEDNGSRYLVMRPTTNKEKMNIGRQYKAMEKGKYSFMLLGKIE